MNEIHNQDTIKRILFASNMKSFEGRIIVNNRIKREAVSLDIIRGVTREPNPEGILAEINTFPSQNSGSSIMPVGSRILFLYKLSDPGNMGSIIRSALGFGWDHVVLIGDCVDPYNFQALKASMGAALKANIYFIKADERSIKEFLSINRINLLFADKVMGVSLDQCKKMFVIPKNGSIGLCLGSESRGLDGFPLSPLEIRKNALKLNISGEVESLNVSVCAGIFLHEINKYLLSD